MPRQPVVRVYLRKKTLVLVAHGEVIVFIDDGLRDIAKDEKEWVFMHPFFKLAGQGATPAEARKSLECVIAAHLAIIYRNDTEKFDDEFDASWTTHHLSRRDLLRVHTREILQ